MPPPLVTIGMAAYNALTTIERAVRSALAQTWRPIEIVAVDDCSSDETFAMLQRLAERHPEIRAYSNDANGGVAVTRNRIVAEARGEFLAFFDDDDASEPTRVAAQFDRIVAYERIYAASAPVICHAARLILYPDGGQGIAQTMGEVEGRPAPSGIAVARRVVLGTPLEGAYGACASCSQMARLSTYRMLGGFDPVFRRSEDTEFNVRLAKAGGHFVGVAHPLVRQEMTRTEDKSLAGEYRFTRLLLQKHRDLVDSDGDYQFACAWIDLKQAWLERRIGLFGLRALLLAVRYPVQSVRRMRLSTININQNRAFRRFHVASRP